MPAKSHNARYDDGRVAHIQCVKNDPLADIDIKGKSFLLILVTDGYARFTNGTAEFTAKAPCFVCFDENDEPKLLGSEGLKCDSVYFHPRFLNVNMSFELLRRDDYERVATLHDLFLLKPFTDRKRFVFEMPEGSERFLAGLFDGMYYELANPHDWYWSCRCRSYFIETMLLLERAYGLVYINGCKRTDAGAENGEVYDSALFFIENNYASDITASDILNAASTNYTTLNGVFKKIHGVTPMEYLWRYRIKIAQKHLEFTSLPIKDIAARCGFKTVNHFNRRFKEFTSVTPNEFRRTAVEKRKEDFR